MKPDRSDIFRWVFLGQLVESIEFCRYLQPSKEPKRTE